jgi:hypothetical protein
MTVQASKPFSGSHWSEVESLNVRTVVELVPEGTLKRPENVKVALIERVHG